MPMKRELNSRWFLLLLLSVVSFIQILHVKCFYFPTKFANLQQSNLIGNSNVSSQWNVGIHYDQYYTDGSQIQAVLVRTNNQERFGIGPTVVCGFFRKVEFDSFLFAIFIIYVGTTASFNTEDGYSIPPQVVWSANRDRPVKENATLNFGQDGNLILRASDGTAVWSTNTSGRSLVGMNLTETGNLVLSYSNNATVWASFDYPTDTLLVGQTLGRGSA